MLMAGETFMHDFERIGCLHAFPVCDQLPQVGRLEGGAGIWHVINITNARPLSTGPDVCCQILTIHKTAFIGGLIKFIGLNVEENQAGGG